MDTDYYELDTLFPKTPERVYHEWLVSRGFQLCYDGKTTGVERYVFRRLDESKGFIIISVKPVRQDNGDVKWAVDVVTFEGAFSMLHGLPRNDDGTVQTLTMSDLFLRNSVFDDPRDALMAEMERIERVMKLLNGKGTLT